jgi:hypothetical protein
MRLLDLFSGTGSVGRAFADRGWEVVSVDCVAKFEPTHCVDILTWDYKQYPPGHFQAVHASPSCTEYSCALQARPRRMEEADKLVRKALEIIAYFAPAAWFMENPWTGYLRKREVVAGLPYVRVDYCRFGAPYRKATAIWGPTALPETKCLGAGKCPAMNGKLHRCTAQHRMCAGHPEDRGFSRTTLYAMPPGLCALMAEHAERMLINGRHEGGGGQVALGAAPAGDERDAAGAEADGGGGQGDGEAQESGEGV